MVADTRWCIRYTQQLNIPQYKLSQKRNAKVVNYDNSVCCASFFALIVLVNSHQR